ncbi:MAG: TRAP transporter small permease subunit [Pseudomonadota bacterium]
MTTTTPPEASSGSDSGVLLTRLFSWVMLAVLIAFLANNFLTHWAGLPGARAVLGDGGALAALQAALYAVMVALAVFFVTRNGDQTLRQDSKRISDMNAFFIRAAFWAVVMIGVVDMIISFLRVEGLLPFVVGESLATELGKSQFRGPYVHFPLMLVGIAIASVTRTLGFIWLALLVVFAELLIVICRFIFSYEQAFMADLVRFWYAALFLFASAYTLLEEGHVRVDVFYAGMAPKTKGYVNAIGSLVLGVVLCWILLIYGMGSKSAVINSPLLSYEVTQAGFGMYVKYLMAGFLGIFAVSMMVQFISYFMDAVADVRGDPGGRDHDVHAVQ